MFEQGQNVKRSITDVTFDESFTAKNVLFNSVSC